VKVDHHHLIIIMAHHEMRGSGGGADTADVFAASMADCDPQLALVAEPSDEQLAAVPDDHGSGGGGAPLDESLVVSVSRLPRISYQELYARTQSHFQTRLEFERLQSRRTTLLMKSARNQQRLEAQQRDDARLLRQSPLSGPAIINTPMRASIGGRPATVPGMGLTTAAVRPDYLDPDFDRSQRAQVLAGVHKCLAHGVLILSGQKLTTVPRSVFNTFAVQTGVVTSVNLSKNALAEVPQEIQYLCNTTVLNLSYNKLVGLPEALGKLAALKVLRLQNNRLEVSE
jgi:hypothetical protein